MKKLSAAPEVSEHASDNMDCFGWRSCHAINTAGFGDLVTPKVLGFGGTLASFSVLGLDSNEETFSTNDYVGQPSHHLSATVNFETEPTFSS